MNKHRVIIVDDEIDACEGLQVLLANQDDLAVVSVCRNGTEAVRAINQHQPDLVFLDIQMPGLNGFEVLDQVKLDQWPAIIFTTAFDEYALHAFEVHALDYLQKPFTDERFYDALEHARQRMVKEPVTSQKVLLSPEQVDPVENRLRLKSGGTIYLLDYDEVIWLEGFDYYIKVHTADRFYLVRDSLKRIIQRLPESFKQVHKSSIVNKRHIRAIEPRSRGAYELSLSHGKTVVLSRNYREQLADWL